MRVKIPAAANSTIVGRYGDFQKNMAKLIAQHPELKELIGERDLREKEYETVRKEKLKGRMFLLE